MASGATEEAAKLKAQGNEAVQKNDFDEAIRLYGEAIALSEADHVLYSNRSAAYAGAKKYEEALVDARKCVDLKPDFAKGYGRMALAQYNLNKLIDAKKSYQQGLTHDSQSQVLKNGLKDTEKNQRRWFITVLGEVADVQHLSQQRICEATHKLIADGCEKFSFLEAHQKILLLDLPSQDTLEKYGISEDDCQQIIGEYDKAYDYEVMTAVQRMMFSPPGKGDPEKAGKLEIATVLEVHKFMEVRMKSLVEEFQQLPVEAKQSISKKEREYSAELMVSVAVESSFKLQSEDLDLAVTMHGEQLQGDAAFVDCQTQLGSLMQLLYEPPYLEKVVEQAPTTAKTIEQASRSESGIIHHTSDTIDVVPMSQSLLGCRNVGIISAVGLVVMFGLIRWKANSR